MNTLCLPFSRGGSNRAAVVQRGATLFAVISTLLVAAGTPSVFADDDHNPIGVTGVFEGMITTGCAYNVLNHNARREIDDIVVPGAIGKYGLKMTRYYNSRSVSGELGAGWTHAYDWGWDLHSTFSYPNGDTLDGSCNSPLGVSDYWLTLSNSAGDFRLADGGTIHFDNSNGYFQVRTIADPYGQTTTLAYYTSGTYLGLLKQVTEPGGRYLQFTYSAQVNGAQMLTEVDAYDGRGNQIDSVVYHYTSEPTGGHYVTSAMCLTSVDYSDGQHAKYTYQVDNVPEHPNQPCPCPVRTTPLVIGADDVRYRGPMRRIAYQYPDQGAHGAILNERYWDGFPGHEGQGVAVSSSSPAPPSPLITEVNFPATFTETRGDTPTRTFNYTSLHLHRQPDDSCPVATLGPPQQFLTSYTDFQGHTTWIGYDPNTWYVTSVTDARGSGPGDRNYTTYYTRGPAPPSGIGQITQIKHPYPDNTTINYDYSGANGGPWYVMTITDERGDQTVHTRDSNHRITHTDHKDSSGNVIAFEDFTYANQYTTNPLGLLLTHHLPSATGAIGPYVHFKYDGRGLLIAKTNPTTDSDWQHALANAPQTTYTYYTSGPWTDRVQTMTLPANAQGLQASETYEYDRNGSGTAVPGRGLITKITHADGNYQSFSYDAYGNKLSEQNELGKLTSYTYDDYNRVVTVKDPIGQTTGHTTTYTYNPTNGGNSSYVHTTNNPDTVTTPAGIMTSNVYDQNFRKTSSVIGGLTTWFNYDAVGNQIYVTDPRGNGSGDPAYTTFTDYDSRNRKTQIREPLSHTTQFFYDDGLNLTRIIRPDQTTETKVYDAMNRLISDTVPKTANPVVNLTTGFGYWPSGKLFSVRDPNGQTTYFQYNEADQMITMYYPDPTLHTIQSWGYDNAHNLTSRTTVHDSTYQGYTQSFTYDIRNRKTGMSWSNKADSASYGYDIASHLTSAVNPNATVTRQYDDAGRLTVDGLTITAVGTVYVNKSYDDDGKETRVWAQGWNYDYTFSYDSIGRFEKVFITNGAQLFQYHYDAASNEIQRDNLPNGVTQYYPRDNLNRMQNMDVKKGNNLLSHEGYGYDAMNRLTSTAREDNTTDIFGYYLNSELQNATYGATNRAVGYTLDAAGNRISVTDSINGTTNYTLNLNNNFYEYSQVGPDSVTNGNEHEISAYQNVTYTYVNDERLQYVSDGSNSYTLAYDALGRCVKRTLSVNLRYSPPPTVYYLYDGEKPIMEYPASDIAHPARNVYGKGVDEILMRTDPTVNGGAAFYYQDDHEGSVTHLTNGSGSIIERYRYDAFGAPTIQGPPPNYTQLSSTAYNNRFLFTGREYAATFAGTYIPTFKFYEYRARAYNPTIGRFMSDDHKLADTGDYNLFRYCRNDPIDSVDPMGTDDHNNAGLDPREVSVMRAEQNLARLQGILNQRLMLGYGASETGGLQYTVNQMSRALGGAESKLAGQIKASIYGKNGAISPKIEHGLIKVFGPTSILVPPQTRENAPFLDTSYDSNEITGMAVAEGNRFPAGQRAGGFNALPTGERPNGTIFIASDVTRFFRNNAFERTYVHELSNILSYRLTGSESTFGSGRFGDTDTGMNVENAVFGGR
jgi:RHS repeat-associated protein